MTNQPTTLHTGQDGKNRCFWVGDNQELTKYHDEEWGVPVADSKMLFEKVCLEGFQSGLSWLTILRKRHNFRQAFHQFDYAKITTYNEADVQRLLNNQGIVRHRGKILSVINNAKLASQMENNGELLATYFWKWEPSQNRTPDTTDEILVSISKSDESIAMSKDLKKRGWSFIGPTTAYAFMESVGIINNHMQSCFLYPRIEQLRKQFNRP